ncbi:transmembrane protein [Salix suchowensis]|nr:transmembrane protein [Salix suchowensis]
MAGPDQAAQHSTEVLHQRRKLPQCPVKMAIGGVALVASLGYFVLYSKKKPEASALDVAKVTAGVADPANTHPRN